MKMLSLFTGIGGIDLAAQKAGIETVGFCEQNEFCQKVLHKHWPCVPIISDVKNITKEMLDNAGINKIDIIAGGFPCQPFSTANQNRKGLDDERSLFPEMLRIVNEVRPTWVIGENVMGFKTLGLDPLLSELEKINYSARSFIIPACGVSAPHRRYRIFVVANANGYGWTDDMHRQTATGWSKIPKSDPRTWNGRLLDQPGICRVVDGIPSRVDKLTKSRLKALGNAVVPEQIYPIFKCIKSIDQMVKEERKAG